MDYSLQQIAQMVDHTNLHADATTADFQKLCDEAIQYGFKSVAINTYPVAMCRKMLEGSQVLTGAAVGFPLGQNTVRIKCAEAVEAVQDGASDIDYVLNIRNFRSKPSDEVLEDLMLLNLAPKNVSAEVVTKLIIECCYLTDGEKVLACRLAKKAGFDFVKTSTGFGSGGATVEDVALMRKTVGKSMGVKAAGGIRTLDDALKMIEAGADRLGCSAGVAIVNAL